MKSGIITIFTLCFSVAVMARKEEELYYSKTQPANLKEEKVTRVGFYLHDILSGKNSSAVRIAHDNLTRDANSPVGFGSLFVMDDPLTLGPEIHSKEIGNGRGMYVSASKEMSKFTIVMYADLTFTTGKFNGSSISIFSRNPVAEEAGEREIAIVGGRGKFRMARGFVKIKTHHIDMKTGDAILRYDATVYHY
ncbi:PREDICTED: dirigent protein 15-like [Camelina sativa]|uniref:Dirigent protein n=1 Tax=Camelina sativa TaxID=90675 RepID=A0ABM0TUU9_CAMSA|nr:PREDICTED: dirigent protein 15-like [Camelina sativa]